MHDQDHQAVSADAYAALAGLGVAVLLPVVALLAWAACCVVRETFERWRG